MNLHVVPPKIADNYDLPYFTDCKSSWTDQTLQIYQIMIVIFLFIIPFILMSVAYWQIAKVLWIKQIPGSAERSSPTANSGSRRNSAAQINRSCQSSSSNRNLFYLCMCYLCGCRCAGGGGRRRKRSRQTNVFNRKVHLNEVDSQQPSPSSINQNIRMSCVLNGRAGGGCNTVSPVDGSLACTPLDTPTGGQPLTQCIVSQSAAAVERTAFNEPITMVQISEANYPSTLSAKHFERQETSIVNLEEQQPLNFAQAETVNNHHHHQPPNHTNDADGPSNSRRTNRPNHLSNNMSNSTTTDSTSRLSLMRTAISKLRRCKLLVQRLLRLDASAKNKNPTNGISLADNNYERQDTNKTELTTLSNGQIEFGSSFQTTSFMRSRSTRARTAEEKNSRASTPIQTLNSHQSSFKRLRRMTLPGNRLSKYIAGKFDSKFNHKNHSSSKCNKVRSSN